MAFTDLENKIAALKSFDFEAEAISIITDNKDNLLEMQKKQLMDGIGVDGEYIRPFYSENPYFKTTEKAYAYALWKQKITPNPSRPIDVPNLFINGQYHESLMININNDEIEIHGTDNNAADIESVHSTALGINEENRTDFAQNILFPQIQTVFNERIFP